MNISRGVIFIIAFSFIYLLSCVASCFSKWYKSVKDKKLKKQPGEINCMLVYILAILSDLFISD